MSTGERVRDALELLQVDENGRLGIPDGPPSIIRQDIPRRRPETSIRAARVQASNVPRNPRHIPLRIIRRPVNGARTPRFPPLSRENLWLTEERPLAVRGLHPDDVCRLCFQVKSHPVSSECGHSHCYVCIRVALESSWNCPHPSCEATMYGPPVRNTIEEEKLAVLYPKREDNSVVNYSFSGLLFPQRPSSPSP
ncbi:hypothetical protein DFH06DRAFT_1333018 [Mycena polygramma]|nr:hypothetical protein DFH06DRAFT_1333018 [Mycena polygramma]